MHQHQLQPSSEAPCCCNYQANKFKLSLLTYDDRIIVQVLSRSIFFYCLEVLIFFHLVFRSTLLHWTRFDVRRPLMCPWILFCFSLICQSLVRGAGDRCKCRRILPVWRPGFRPRAVQHTWWHWTRSNTLQWQVPTKGGPRPSKRFGNRNPEPARAHRRHQTSNRGFPRAGIIVCIWSGWRVWTRLEIVNQKYSRRYKRQRKSTVRIIVAQIQKKLIHTSSSHHTTRRISYIRIWIR